MAMNNETPKAGGSGGGSELEKRVTAVETGLGVVAKTMVTAEVLQRELGVVRAETAKEFAAVREEMAKGFAAVREEMAKGFAAVRDEMNKESRALRAEIGDLRVDIARVPFETAKWLLATLGIAAAVATAIYNIWFR
jgi:hypothetical protein